LRSAPDRLLFGEIRSQDTAAIAVRAALTGHPVLTTLHTDGCLQVVPRLMDLGVSPSLLRNQGVLRAITSQRLLRVLCRCRTPCSREEWGGYCPPWLEAVFRREGRVHLPNRAGCGSCRGGYAIGRRVVAEIMRMDDKLLELQVEGRIADALAYWKSIGGVPMLEQAQRGVARGDFDPYEVMRCLNS
jgi:type II secretory ATPase GspE/PulE/Tfp pilus assembly ATPase PilB-like protein